MNTPKNNKIDNLKYKILLSEKLPTKRKNNIIKSISVLNLTKNSQKSVSIDRKRKNIKPFIKLLKTPIKTKYSLNEETIKNIKNKEVSISINITSEIQNDNSNKYNKLVENLFRNQKKMFPPKEAQLLNNLNLIYSENDLQFDKFYLKHRNKKSLRGLGLTHIQTSPKIIKNNIDSKINFVKSKLSIIKSIVDFTYPEIIIRRSMKQSNDYIKKFKKTLSPSKYELLKKKEKNKYSNDYYSTLLQIIT